eukprot:1343472-Rhodomonas_salina.2
MTRNKHQKPYTNAPPVAPSKKLPTLQTRGTSKRALSAYLGGTITQCTRDECRRARYAREQQGQRHGLCPDLSRMVVPIFSLSGCSFAWTNHASKC